MSCKYKGWKDTPLLICVSCKTMHYGINPYMPKEARRMLKQMGYNQ